MTQKGLYSGELLLEKVEDLSTREIDSTQQALHLLGELGAGEANSRTVRQLEETFAPAYELLFAIAGGPYAHTYHLGDNIATKVTTPPVPVGSVGSLLETAPDALKGQQGYATISAEYSHDEFWRPILAIGRRFPKLRKIKNTTMEGGLSLDLLIFDEDTHERQPVESYALPKDRLIDPHEVKSQWWMSALHSERKARTKARLEDVLERDGVDGQQQLLQDIEQNTTGAERLLSQMTANAEKVQGRSLRPAFQHANERCLKYILSSKFAEEYTADYSQACIEEDNRVRDLMTCAEKRAKEMLASGFDGVNRI